jgi:hypothetical protein
VKHLASCDISVDSSVLKLGNFVTTVNIMVKRSKVKVTLRVTVEEKILPDRKLKSARA